MQGVGPGSLLGGRYLLSRRTEAYPRYERWSAADQTLDREVVLLCFDVDSPVGAVALDAARRAAGVEEARLVRVLDVGRESGTAFVVEEPLRGARSLTATLTDGGEPAEEARRVTGEVASALENARARGLHHGVLTPRSVFRLGDGAVKVRGLATEAALVEADDLPPAEATRSDTLAVVGLLYAMLTARWPLPGADSGLEAAPRVVGGVAAPSEIAAGVPADLDLVARTTLTEDGGPRTPGELAERIGPWSPAPVEATGAHPGRRLPGTRTEPLDRDPVTRGVAAGPARATGQDNPVPSEATTNAPVGSAPAEAAKTGGLLSVLGLTLGLRGAPEDEAGAASGTSRSGADEAESHGPEGGASSEGAGEATDSRAGKGLGTALGAAGRLAASVSGRMGGLARSAADRAAERSAARAERRQAERWEDPLEAGEDVRLSDTLEDSDEQLEPPIGMLPEAAHEPLGRDQSRIALAIVVVGVLVVAVLGLLGVASVLSAQGGSSAAPVVTRTVTATPSGSASAGTTTGSAPTTSAPPVQPVAIAAASQLSEDAGVQASRTAALAYDGNPATVWRSSKWYASAKYGGLPSHTTGLLVDLGQPTDVHTVAFTTRGASDVSVLVADNPSASGATPVGSVAGTDGDATVSVPNGGAVKGRYVILWFTSLGPDGEGHFRAQVAEVSVR